MVKRRISRLTLLLSCAAFVSSCDTNLDDSLSEVQKIDPIDREAQLTREDFTRMRDIESVKKPAEISANLSNVVEPPIPDLAEVLISPPKPKIGETQLVSLAVTDDVPLKDVLLEVARLAKVDIDVDASITGGISMRVTDKPFNEVIDRIADMGGLRYNMKNGVLRIERDTPYIQVYTLDLLNIDRSSRSDISSSSSSSGGGGSSSSSSSSSGSSSGGSSSGGSGSSGSSSSITYKADSDFWSKFEASIAQILAYKPAQMSSATTISAQPAPALPDEKSGGDKKSADSSPLSPSMKPMQAVGVSLASANPAQASVIPTVTGNQPFYILNRQAATLTVSATQKQHETIKKFIDTISQNASAQVLIEAKIVEVNLNDNYQTGIDWTKFGGTSLGFTADMNPTTASSGDTTVPKISLLKNDILRTGLGLDTAISLLNKFGTARGISSPRLHAVNNQQAVLSFVENLVYFSVEITTTDAVTDPVTHVVTTPAKVEVKSEQKSSPVGLVLNLQPSINKSDNEVTLSVRPTITKKTNDIADPGFEVAKANAVALLGSSSDAGKALSAVKSNAPQIETRELDSIVKIKSGQTLVIGGLLEDKITNTDDGVPYVSEVPIFGNLFKSVSKTNNKKELVIFLRATIVGTNGDADPYDKAMYEKFIEDPRPLKF